jgi:nucleoside-diphosphate-sugar epimerase
MTRPADGRHVVVGTGPVGAAVARTLVDRGTPASSIRLVNRSGEPGASPGPSDLELVAGDVSDPDRAREVCAGAAVVYLCASPPYGRWPEAFPPLMDGAIAGAAAADARLVFADNCYMYGPVDGPMTEDLPYDAETEKGTARAAVARRLLDAHEDGEVDAAIGRASDFYGPGVRHSLVGERVFEPAITGDRVSLIGDPDAPHTVTYVDDFGEALVTLGADDRAPGRAWHVPNAPTRSVREFVDLVAEVAGTDPTVRRVPTLLVRALGIVSSRIGETVEVFYQYDEPFVVDDTAFVETFGDRPAATPLPEGIARTIEWYRSVGAGAGE